MIPKIEFRYSSIYDEFNKKYLETYYKAYKKPKTKILLKKYPSQKKLENYIKKIKPLWKNKEKKILTEIAKITGLKWREKKIRVYLVGKCIPFSDPLTMPPYKDKDEFIDTLTHELIHQIQMQADDKLWKKWWAYIKQNYGKELRKTKSHILLHAVHWEIYLRLFNKRHLEENIKKSSRNEPYRKAWEIVQKEGHENIIKKFKELTK